MIIAAVKRSPVIKTQNAEEEAIPLLQRDLDILQQRLSDLTGAKVSVPPLTVSSSFVSGIRRVTEEKKYTDADRERLPILEKILSKITEFDREVLKKTSADRTSDKNRRKTVSGDLFCLPTHLTIVDRLLDLYKQSQRVDGERTVVTVIVGSEDSNLAGVASVSAVETTVPPVLSASPDTKLLIEEKAVTAELKTEVSSLIRQISALQSTLSTAVASESDSSKEVVTLQQALSDSSKEVLSLQQALAKSKELHSLLAETFTLSFKADTSAPLAEITAELDLVRSQLESSESSKIALEEQLEVEVAVNQSIRTALLAGAANLNNDEETVHIGSSSLSGEGSAALDSLSAALVLYAARRAKKVDNLSESLISMTAQLADATSSKDTLQEDYIALMTTHGKLDKDHSALQQEHEKYIEEQQQKIDQNKINSDTKIAEEKIKILQASLTASIAQCADLELNSKNFNKKILQLEDESRNQKLEISSLSADATSLQKLVETLKTKVREMTGKDSSFLDSFEEVMHDEMLAMKWAFEAKLKVAKEKADAMSLRHAQEIQRMNERSG